MNSIHSVIIRYEDWRRVVYDFGTKRGTVFISDEKSEEGEFTKMTVADAIKHIRAEVDMLEKEKK